MDVRSYMVLKFVHIRPNGGSTEQKCYTIARWSYTVDSVSVAKTIAMTCGRLIYMTIHGQKWLKSTVLDLGLASDGNSQVRPMDTLCISLEDFEYGTDLQLKIGKYKVMLNGF